MTSSREDIAATCAEQDRHSATRRIRIGCALAMILLLLGSLVDRFWCPSLQGQFLLIRLAGAGLILPILLLVSTSFGARWYGAIEVLPAMIPAAAIALIIHQVQPGAGTPSPGAPLPYNAGLNLVLLVLGLVLQWTVTQSVMAVLLVLGMYLLSTAGKEVSFGSPLWFLPLTGLLIVIGNRVQDRLRDRGRAASDQLDPSRQELEASNQRLRELAEAKGRFLANISHELRTPLTLLLGHLESVRNHPATADPRMREQLETMHSHAMRLLKLINDLLDLVRLDAGHPDLKLEPISVERILQGLRTSVERLARERGLKLECEVRPGLTHVRADEEKLEKVLLNLLFNSLKFTPAGGSVRVLAYREGEQGVFEVSDTGQGIAPEYLDRLFTRFWQADNSAQRKSQGVGIGLALVKELIEAHGGTVAARSQVGVGTTITVCLPAVEASLVVAAAVPTQTPGPAPDTEAWLAGLYRRAELFTSLPPVRDNLRPWTPPERSERPRVLIADDEPDMLRFLRLHLGEEYEVLEAMDGQQAMTMASEHLPDLILCDMMMPEKDGLQVCRELRAHPSTQSIPFIMLTARADDDAKLQALSIGVNDFLAKPFSTAELRVRLKNLVEGHHSRRSLERQNQKLKETLEQLKETELQLIQSEKMASLGHMSAGIIHEINNPLNYTRTGIFTLTRLAKRLDEPDRAEFQDTLHDIEEGITRVAGIVTDLRAFTHRTGRGEVRVVDVPAAVAAALRFMAAEWRDRVEIQDQIPPGFTVYAAHSKLTQVFVNLLQNSLDALKTKTFQGESPTIRLSAVERGNSRLIAVWDNGPGIPAHQLSRVFDPFFTTKEVGQGTGLGLSIVFRLLAEFNGRITVRSEEGQFCEFTLEFPRDVSQPPTRDN